MRPHVARLFSSSTVVFLYQTTVNRISMFIFKPGMAFVRSATRSMFGPLVYHIEMIFAVVVSFRSRTFLCLIVLYQSTIYDQCDLMLFFSGFATQYTTNATLFKHPLLIILPLVVLIPQRRIYDQCDLLLSRDSRCI